MINHRISRIVRVLGLGAITLIAGLLIILIFVVALGFAMNRYCYVDAAKRIGVVANNSREAYEAIVVYFDDQLIPGITHNQVLEILGRVSSVREISHNPTTVAVNGRERLATRKVMTITYKCCASMTLLLTYLDDDTLYKHYLMPD
jgi:hypothetical protein